MNFFEKSKVLTIAVIGLLVLNFATLAFLVFHKPQMPFPMGMPRKEAHEHLGKMLNLNDTQKEQINKLREEHAKTISQIQDTIKTLKDQLFDQLKTGKQDSSMVNNITSKIAENQKHIEMATFYHFAKMRALLSDEQKSKFDNIMNDMLKMVGPHPPDGPMMRYQDGPPPLNPPR